MKSPEQVDFEKALELVSRQRDEAIMMLRDAPRPELFFNEQLPGYGPFDDGYGKWYHSPERRALIKSLFPDDGGVAEGAPKRKWEVRDKGKAR